MEDKNTEIIKKVFDRVHKDKVYKMPYGFTHHISFKVLPLRPSYYDLNIDVMILGIGDSVGNFYTIHPTIDFNIANGIRDKIKYNSEIRDMIYYPMELLPELLRSIAYRRFKILSVMYESKTD
jgi:hypothetical protein